MKPLALIVDDSITVRMDLKESLEEGGFEALCCATAAAAHDALARRNYDVVILDVLLPDMDGLEFLRELKTAPATRGLPVMLLSSEDEVRDRVRGLETGADEYLGKPYNPAQVLSRARELLRLRAPQARQRPLVLCVDDSLTFRETLGEALKGAGYDVAAAASGEEGLRQAADLRPDALIVDQNMPGLDGLELLRRVRADAALRRLPCLLLTSDERSELRALEAGADAFVAKSGEPDLILAKLAALLRGSAPMAAQGSSLFGPKRVLAVDDSPSYLGELAERLRDEGYDVAQASSGEEALQLLAVQSVDAILMDLGLPGLSGKEACARIKAKPAWREIPLLILTAREEREAMLDGINAGADDYITKSADFNVLMARLKAQLRRRQFEDENQAFREQLLRREMEAIELQAVRELSEARAASIADLEAKNIELRKAQEAALALAKELESFSYAVSHDLRAPLRSIHGFSQALLEDYAATLDAAGHKHLERVCAATDRMAQLIDDMLSLAQVSRKELVLEEVDLSALARQVADELQALDPAHPVQVQVQPGLRAQGDPGLLRILFENLLGNARKFSSKQAHPRIDFLREELPGQGPAFTLRDNGVGFDMAYAHKLFGAFQRLHAASEFPGTGVGLATVQRVLGRHQGRIWAESAPGAGASFHFAW
jgi:two-component system NtrC family sensor kinase